MPPLEFEIFAQSASCGARVGRVSTLHGSFETPAFMPVGTLAAVKGLTVDQLAQVGTQMVLANTYHLALRPGADVVAEMGGLHGFMQWDGPILTDSGGFQVFSLAKLAKLDDDGVAFRLGSRQMDLHCDAHSAQTTRRRKKPSNKRSHSSRERQQSTSFLNYRLVKFEFETRVSVTPPLQHPP